MIKQQSRCFSSIHGVKIFGLDRSPSMSDESDPSNRIRLALWLGQAA